MTTPLVTVQDLAALLPDQPLLLDCRFDLDDLEQGRQEYLVSHIPGAHYLHLNDDLSGEIIAGQTGRHPLPELTTFAARMSALGLTPDRPVVAYDDKGGGIAARAWWLLKAIGHQQVAVLDGGFPFWVIAGQATAAGQEEAQAAPAYPIALDASMCTRDRAQVDALRQDPDYVLIDSRSAERYRGENETIDPVAGCIEGAINLPWPENLDGRTFKSPAELRERFAALKEKPQQNVFYCGSGVTACHNVLAYYYAFDEMPALYPGSWSDYLLGLK
ncbi:Putative thiosulfate sulfurtransferase SseB [Neolewinella maritima]|uniref:Thiosulfate sulfurtransferase SseB n=1 Tax=Neolewinella maritima TaxID=1383882 RepID=A0ABM9B162_9BACT|nr:sulfurtransferase [Neolewinella maritima]CAH1000886.1 Putative thiosulfate sulfurtransferase SseB [Neolewinella maritima]